MTTGCTRPIRIKLTQDAGIRDLNGLEGEEREGTVDSDWLSRRPRSHTDTAEGNAASRVAVMSLPALDSQQSASDIVYEDKDHQSMNQ